MLDSTLQSCAIAQFGKELTEEEVAKIVSMFMEICNRKVKAY